LNIVVRSLYRHVRNPMISGVLCVLLGEAVLFVSPAILLWLVLFLAVNLAYMPLSEEPALEKRFGDEYVHYRENVPAWIPRLKPWEPGPTDSDSGSLQQTSRRIEDEHLD
jgi:protein-S-isoprenylcysteine O-methyltransferase Ste14